MGVKFGAAVAADVPIRAATSPADRYVVLFKYAQPYIKPSAPYHYPSFG